MKRHKRHANLWWKAAGWLAVAGLGFANAVLAQPVVYVGTNTAGGSTLRVINSDGTGDRLIPVALPEVQAISFSKDGRYLALTSRSPDHLGQLSRNVFVLDLLTEVLTPITAYQDQVIINQGQTNFAYVTPSYHAFSPDNAHLAVWEFTSTLQGTFPTLERYRLSDGMYLETIAYEQVLTGSNESGNGVEYHPTQNLLVAPRRVTILTYPYGTAVEGTALILYSTAWQQLTSPSGWQSGANFILENDYAPAFSPNGQEIAYLRAANYTYAGRQPWIVTLRIVNVDGSNDHAVGSLAQGVYATRLSWSRNGTQLVFDAGTQQFIGGDPVPAVAPATDALWIVNTNGTGMQMLRAAPASCPVWSPIGTTFCNLPGVVQEGGVPGSGTIDDCGAPLVLQGGWTPAGQFRLDISGGTPNLLYQIKASSDLGEWQSLGTTPYVGPTTSFTDPNSTSFPRRFYRVVLGNH